MRSVRFTTLGTVLLASALPVVGAVLVIVDHPRSAAKFAPELVQSELHLDVRTFSGKISRKNAKFFFRDDHENSVFFMDDQQAAKRFSRKSVLVTGTVDSNNQGPSCAQNRIRIGVD